MSLDIEWDLIKSQEDSLAWFGHSTVLLSIDGKKLFIDAVFLNHDYYDHPDDEDVYLTKNSDYNKIRV